MADIRKMSEPFASSSLPLSRDRPGVDFGIRIRSFNFGAKKRHILAATRICGSIAYGAVIACCLWCLCCVSRLGGLALTTEILSCVL